jgi:hypothetical protein
MLGGDQTLHIALAGLASPGGGGDRVVGASGVRAAGRPGRVVVLNSDSVSDSVSVSVSASVSDSASDSASASFRASACDQ